MVRRPAATYHLSMDERADALVLLLSPAEAMTVAAALRQYEPYWSPRVDADTLAAQLTDVREQITAVLARLRAAAAG